MVQGFRLSAVWAVLVLEEGALTIRIGFRAGGVLSSRVIRTMVLLNSYSGFYIG